jgi:hypothetical protein
LNLNFLADTFAVRRIPIPEPGPLDVRTSCRLFARSRIPWSPSRVVTIVSGPCARIGMLLKSCGRKGISVVFLIS